MTEQIKKLLEFQELDLELDRAEKAIKGCDERKKATLMKQKFEAASAEKKKLSDAREVYAEEVRRLSSEIERLAEKVEASQEQPQTAEEADALLAEIDKLTRQLDKAEQRLGQIGAALATGEKKSADLSALSVKLKEAYNTNAKAYNEKFAAAKPELDKQRTARDEKAAQVEPELMEKYMRLKANKVLPPVAALKQSRCGGCHMELPMSVVQNAAKNGFCECENCGRFLYTE